MRTFRPGTPADIPAICRIYDKILDREEAGGVTTGWRRGIYPTEQTAADALRAGELFVQELDGCVTAAARINRCQVPEYAQAAWQQAQAPADQVMVLHTLVVDPDCRGQGCGTAFMAFYEDYALRHGCPYLRIDTNERNAPARRLYARLGFREAGVVSCTFNGLSHIRLVCLEKTLLSEAAVRAETPAD